jgi:hypothetical protein
VVSHTSSSGNIKEQHRVTLGTSILRVVVETTWDYVGNSASEVWPQEVSKLTLGTVLSLLVELCTLVNSQALASRLGGVFEDITGLTFVTDCSFGLDITVGNLHLTTSVVHEIEG